MSVVNGPPPENKSGGGPFSRFGVGFLVGCAAVLIVVAGLLVIDTGMRRSSDVQRAVQPSDVVYPDGATHLVGLVEVRSWLLRRHLGYQVYAGRDPGISYGHFVRIGMTGVDRPVIDEVRWTAEGARLRFRSGHELLVPAGEFIGGR